MAKTLHRVADRIDRRAAPRAAAPQFAALPCAPVLASGFGGAFAGSDLANGLGLGGDTPRGGPSGLGGRTGSTGPIFAGGGPIGGGGGGAPFPVATPSAGPSPPPTTAPKPGENLAVVAEPTTWALLISGFGAVGAVMRGRRIAAA